MNLSSLNLEDFGYIQWAMNLIEILIFFMSFILLPLGLIFNIIEFCVFYFAKFKNTSMSFYFLLNCGLNILIIVFILIYTTGERIFKVYLSITSDTSCKIYMITIGTLYFMHSWLNVTIVADRLYFTLFPNKYSFNQIKIVFLLFGLTFFMILMNSPNLWFYLNRVERTSVNQTVISKYCTAPTQVLLVRDTISIVMRTMVPFCLMLVMNLILIYRIKESKRKFSKKNEK